jgi:hydrogenase maturation protease
MTPSAEPQADVAASASKPKVHGANQILVLGLGNDLLTDDAVGLHVARAVRAKLTDEPRVVVRETMEMGLALLDEIAGFDALVLVDSIQTETAPAGRIHEFDLAALGGRRITAPHFVGVTETLALGRTLGLAMPQEVRIVAVEVADPFTLGTQLTPAVERAVEVAAPCVTKRVRELMLQPMAAAP